MTQQDELHCGRASPGASAGHLDQGKHLVGSWMRVLEGPRETPELDVQKVRQRPKGESSPAGREDAGLNLRMSGRQEVGKQTRV